MAKKEPEPYMSSSERMKDSNPIFANTPSSKESERERKEEEKREEKREKEEEKKEKEEEKKREEDEKKEEKKPLVPKELKNLDTDMAASSARLAELRAGRNLGDIPDGDEYWKALRKHQKAHNKEK